MPLDRTVKAMFLPQTQVFFNQWAKELLPCKKKKKKSELLRNPLHIEKLPLPEMPKALKKVILKDAIQMFKKTYVIRLETIFNCFGQEF